MKKLTLIFVFALMLGRTQAQDAREFIYVGTYSIRGSEGIYVFEFNRTTGTLRKVQTNSSMHNPSFLELHPKGNYLYAAGEFEKNGSAGSFSIKREDGKLTFINRTSTEGGGAAHIAIDHFGKFAFVSNYGGGSFTILPIRTDGGLSAATEVIQHNGSSINKERQQAPHVHSAYVSPDNQFVLVSDLGTDKIHSYRIDYVMGKVPETSRSSFISVVPGAGPRHLVFHPDGKFVFSAEELTSTVGVFAYDKETGTLKVVKDTVRSLPSGFTAFNKSADIHTDPDGKFLYMSNRGLDAIAIFSIRGDGQITLIGQQSVMGKTPRNFLVDPKGEFVFVANQDSDNIVIFKLDRKTGLMTYTGNQVSVPSPVCLKMLRL